MLWVIVGLLLIALNLSVGLLCARHAATLKYHVWMDKDENEKQLREAIANAFWFWPIHVCQHLPSMIVTWIDGKQQAKLKEEAEKDRIFKEFLER